MFDNYVDAAPTSQNKVSASWYDPNFRVLLEPPPRNGKATAALVLGIISFLTAPLSLITFILTIVFSSLALKSAREFELAEKRPVGRTRARWAVFLVVLTVAWTGVAAVGAYTFAQERLVYNEQVLESQMQAQLSDQGLTGYSVDCPAEGSFTAGSVISCVLTDPAGASAIMDYTVPDTVGAEGSWVVRR